MGKNFNLRRRNLVYAVLIFMLMSIIIVTPAGAARKVTIQAPPVAAALPLLWMKDSGQLDNLVDLEINISSDHQRGLALMARGDIGLLVTGVNVGAKAYNRGIGMKLLNVNTWSVDYLLTSGFQTESWNDLKGKSLVLPLKGGPLDFLARYLLRENGVNPEDVNIIYRPLPGSARYFMAGKVDSIVLPEPLVTISLVKNKEANLSLDIQKEWGKLHDGDWRIPYVGLFVSEKLGGEDPGLVKMINGMYLQGIEWVNNHPVEAVRLAAGYQGFSVPPKLFLESFKRVDLNYYGQSKSKTLIKTYFNEILEMYPDMLGGRLPDEEFYF